MSKLSISNIAWKAENDSLVYDWMKKYNFSGLEIAPTRIFPNKPYSDLKKASKWGKSLREQYGFVVSSMQSIWFGKQEKIFGSQEERDYLVEYTKMAIDFAQAINCKNLVFGCPRNRVIHNGTDISIAVEFFKEIGDYAAINHTVIGMEANPPIYNTNFINDTTSALELIKIVNSDGLKLNLDVGTMIQNQESVSELAGNINLINHVHISEPYLKSIQVRNMHNELRDLLLSEKYDGYISIEMGYTEKLNDIENAIKYVMDIFR